MKTLRLFFTALVAFVLPLAAADEAYEIRLQRPVKAGDRFKVAAKITVDSEDDCRGRRAGGGENPRVVQVARGVHRGRGDEAGRGE
jgi:hypothetical protein